MMAILTLMISTLKTLDLWIQAAIIASSLIIIVKLIEGVVRIVEVRALVKHEQAGSKKTEIVWDAIKRRSSK